MRMLTIGLCLMLAGCQEGLAEKYGLRFKDNRELAQEECDGLGYRFGTEAYADCYERVRARLQAQDDARGIKEVRLPPR
jgi:hypothetical protein